MPEPPETCPPAPTVPRSYAPAAARPRKGLAVAALACAVVSTPGLLLVGLPAVIPFPVPFVLEALAGLVGIALGAIAAGRARREPKDYGGRRLAIAAVICGVLGLVGAPVVFVAILASAMQSLQNVNILGVIVTAVPSALCDSRLSHLNEVLSSYAAEHGTYAATLQALEDEGYLRVEERRLKCPTPAVPGRMCDYYYVQPPTEPNALRRARKAGKRWIVAFEDAGNHPQVGANVLYLDGHTAPLSSAEFAKDWARFKAEYEKVVGRPPLVVPPQ